MATVRKILGQVKVSAATDATLYTVPGATDTVVSSIVVSEVGAATATFRICVDAAGGTTTVNTKSLVWDQSIAANATVGIALGITLAAAATVVVRASTANVTFTAFGQENT
jgi:hypothetical protein